MGHLVPHASDASTQAASSAGGGLIWLSASSASGSLTFGSWVELRAEGLPGGVAKYASGGGAGGQILIFATKIAADDEAWARERKGSPSLPNGAKGVSPP